MLLAALPAFTQVESDERALIEIKDGISFKKDSILRLNLRFRMQNRFGFTTVAGDDLRVNQVEARVRRMRLRFDGYVVNPKIQYYVQLSFSRADQDLEVGTIPQTVRDAILYYVFSPNFYVGFGQSKLPGNRQRVISSGNQQFPDRAITNALMNIDRDFGFFAYYTQPIGPMLLIAKGAMTKGDGRNALANNNGLAYTGRLEWLPLGEFKNLGDYSEGDLEREPKPKLSFGATYSTNLKAMRTGGQLGQPLFNEVTINTFIADALLKYRGWALSSEYLQRMATNPVTFGPFGDSHVYTGWGINTQLSHYFACKYELAGRFTHIRPSDQMDGLERPVNEAMGVITRYINGHRVKANLMAGYRWHDGMVALDHPRNRWQAMFQVEFGI